MDGSGQPHLSARPVVLGAVASQATGRVLDRYGRYRAFHAAEAENASFRAIADAAAAVTSLPSWITWWSHRGGPVGRELRKRAEVTQWA